MKKITYLFIIIFLILILYNYTIAGEKYAVLAAVEDYSNWDYPWEFDDSPYSNDDLFDLRELLIYYGGWSDENIEILTGYCVTDTKIENSVRRMVDTLAQSNDDICLFFFSGHGEENGSGLCLYNKAD
ncbi:MAG: caspase family protein, partial [Promethearchaeota archaeon]